MRVAVVGAGAAATGVLRGLVEWGGDCETWLFGLGSQLPAPPDKLVADGFDSNSFRQIYSQLRTKKRFAFPPPKSHFGKILPKHEVAGKRSLWRSSNYGGLMTIWGGGMFPFTDRELASWPVHARDLDPYYKLIAERVGVCGEADALNDYFERDYVNRPPLRTSPVVRSLLDSINATKGGDHFDFVAGASRLALETRSGLENSCDYLGECMLGCPRKAIWSADRELDRYKREGSVSQHVTGRVLRFKETAAGSFLEVEAKDGDSVTEHGPFDRIFVAAGCIGSTEIVMRSLGIEHGPQMLDNAVVSFPVLYTGHAPTSSDRSDRYFSLCNASIGAVPKDRAQPFAQISIYPAFDHLWRYYTPSPLWSLAAPLWRFARWRFLLGRVFFAGSLNRTYSFALSGSGLEIAPNETPPLGETGSTFMREFRAATNHGGFYVPPVPPGGHATSSHYAGTFPYGCDVLPSRSGRIAPRVYLADASTWPTAPSISPTFTIMANACRTAHEALEDSN